jgi:voltage-gated potassium channel
MSPLLTSQATEALDRPLHAPGKRLFIGGERSVRRSLLRRAVVVFVMFFAVVLLFWFDRDGLRDNADGHLSFSDVVYFSVVTLTTVGYGDIVPVTRRARLIDAALVTPIRLLIWLIFLGTAYQLVLQRLIEDLRMRVLQARLQNHIIICGFGHAGRCAAAELTARGFEKREILVVDVMQSQLEDAAGLGYVGLLSNATHEETLRRAMIHTARALFVCTDRDDTNVLIVLTARHLSPQVRIISRVEEAENEKLLRQSGANAAVLPSRIGGILMADSLDTSAIASAVTDLISAGGGVTMHERPARDEDIGRMPKEIAGELVVRVLRDSRALAFWEDEARIRFGDRLVVIAPVTPAANGER